MSKYAGTKTEQNLLAAFAGESEARNKYTFYASAAKKAGYEQLAALYLETADQEKEHAKMWFKELHGGSVPGTLANLIDAAAGEHGEWTDMYKRMAEEAKAEGFDEIAYKFAEVAKIEKRHEERYNKLSELVKNGAVFNKTDKKVWICRNCGHIHVGDSAPDVCPVCDHPKAYFQLLNEEF